MPVSKPKYDEAYVWIWLPGQTKPVVAGRLARYDGKLLFNYGDSYLARKNAISLYTPELPLEDNSVLELTNTRYSMPSCIRDAAPDAWGQRVIINKFLGNKSTNTDTNVLDDLTYLLESGSDRIGALDFQKSATQYVPRSSPNSTLNELIESAERVEKGIPLTEDLDRALYHGSSVGGARPKALIDDIKNNKKYIAKFPSSSDTFNLVKTEFITMRLAALANLDVAPVKLKYTSGKDVLLIERFDRYKTATGWVRRNIVSALTILNLYDMDALHVASYQDLASAIRHSFSQPKNTLKELFSRMGFNILCGNNDDHARNHAAFWDGKMLTLTPAYDICAQFQQGQETRQAMLIYDGIRESKIKNCMESCNNFLLSKITAKEIIDFQIAVIESKWDDVCDEAQYSDIDRKRMWRKRVLNPCLFE